MLLLRHCCLQKEDEVPVLDWDDIVEHAAAAGIDGDVLQLALNCTNHAVALAATKSIHPAHLEPDVACRLLLTAAARRHGSALFCLARWRQCEQQVDVQTLEKLLHLALSWTDCTALLCKMPAAAQLSSEQVSTLLRKAVQSSDDWRSLRFRSLLFMPAAEQLSSMCMEQLLQSAVVCDKVSLEGMRVLCSKPAAGALSCEAVARLLQAAAQLGEGLDRSDNYKLLCRLPGAAQMTSSMVAAAMRAAAESKHFGLLLLLYELPAAQQLSSADLQVISQARQL
jgi:hypothetical protein